MGMLSSGLESDSNSSEHGYSKTQRGDTKREKKPNSNNFDKNQNGFDPGTVSHSQYYVAFYITSSKLGIQT